MCVSDWEVAKRLGLSKSDLLYPAMTVFVADNASLELVGAHFMTIFAESGQSTQQLVYFATGVGEFYLSKSALIDLQVIPKEFPVLSSVQPSINVFNMAQHQQGPVSVQPGPTQAGYTQEVQDEFSSGLHRSYDQNEVQ